MKLLLVTILAVFGSLLTLFASAVYAVDISTARYVANVSLTNTGSTGQSNFAMAIPLSGKALVDSGFMSTSTLNTVIVDTDLTTKIHSQPPSDRIDIRYAILQDNTSYFNQSSAARNSTANDVQVMLPAAGVEDHYYFGADHPFDILTIEVGTAGDWEGTLQWEYWDSLSSTYTPLSNVVDNTNGFRNSGIESVSWTSPANWTATTTASLEAFYVRTTFTAITSQTITPIASQVWYETGRWWTYVEELDGESTEFQNIALASSSSFVTSHAFFPGTGGYTIADDSSMEPGADFDFTYDGWLDTSLPGTAFEAWTSTSTLYFIKPDSLALVNNTSTEIGVFDLGNEETRTIGYTCWDEDYNAGSDLPGQDNGYAEPITNHSNITRSFLRILPF